MQPDEPRATLGATKQPLSKRSQILIVGVVALIVVVLVVAAVLAKHLFASSTEEPTASTVAHDPPGTFRPTKAQWATLGIAEVKAISFRTEVSAEGSIAVNDDATTPVFSPYSGRVSKLIAKPGDVVRAGAPLMTVEASEFVQGQSDLSSAAGALRSAQSQLQLAQTTENRQHELFLAKAGAQKDWLQSQADLATAQNNVKVAEASLAAVRNRLRILGRSEAQVSALESAPASENTNPEAVVVAPISGTITQRQVGLGQYINSASNGAASPVYSVSNLNSVWLVANVREIDAPLVRVGEPVAVRVLAYPGRVFKAKLTWVASQVDPNTHRLPVRAEVENPGGALKPMMFASFSIFAGDEVTAPGVPESAIVYEAEDARVWAAQPDGTVISRAIRTGRSSENMVEVVEGLKVGDKIVASGTLFIDRAAQDEHT